MKNYTFLLFSAVLLCSHSYSSTEDKFQYEIPLIHDATPEEIQQIIQNITVKKAYEIPALVRQGAELPAYEIKALSKRLPKIRKHMQKVFKEKLSYQWLPNISLISSGGGYRSMISTLGFLRGAQKIGLLDSAWYMTTLSGSTWMYSGFLRHKCSLSDYKSILQKKVATNLFLTSISLKGLVEILVRKIVNSQEITLVDFWGAMIGNMLFSDLSLAGKDIFLSDLGQIVENGNYPLPIFTSISPWKDSYTWFEHTPWEVGSSSFNAFIPTNTFGSVFNTGKVIDINPEQTLGYHLGTFSSAFAVSASDLLRYFKDQIENEKIINVLENVINIFNLNDVRVSSAEINNFMKHLSSVNQLPKSRTLQLIDAGIDFALPIPPMMRRYVDILVISDTTSNVGTHQELKYAYAYAKKNGMKFPEIVFENIDINSVSVFIDKENLKTPIVIYIPHATDYSLFKFQYSDAEFNDLYGSMKLKVEKNIDIIWQAISKKVEQLKMLYPNKMSRA